jgi:hypothetical protein
VLEHGKMNFRVAEILGGSTGDIQDKRPFPRLFGKDVPNSAGLP